MNDLQRFKEEFSDKEGVQFNCAGIAPLSRSAALEYSRLVTVHQTLGGLSDSELIPVLIGTRAAVAEFIDAKPEQVAFSLNCATALSQVALGFPLRPGDVVVTVDQEYSSNFYPWKVAADRAGAKLVVVQSSSSAFVSTEDVISAVKPGVKLVGVSWVQFQTGAIMDLKRLADHCHSVGAMLAVDAIQGIGQLPFSFAESGVDFVASGSHKWICGPTGQAFFAIKPDLMSQIELQAVGGGTFGRFGTFADVASPMEATAKRFEAGGYNFVSLAALSAAIKVLQSVGVVTVAEEISRLTALLRAGLREFGIALATPVEQVGGHTSFELPVEWEAKLLVRAREERIAIAKRGKFIRTAIHAYCSDSDVDHFLGVVGGCR